MNELQSKLFEILKDVDSIARKNDLKYSLAFGSAIGAIREGGFIPWDDDIDIIIDPKIEKQFIETLEHELDPNKYHILKPFTIDWHHYLYKVYMKNTMLVQDLHDTTRVPTEIFLDIFVAHRYPITKPRRALYNTIHRMFYLEVQMYQFIRGRPQYDWLQKIMMYFLKKTHDLAKMIPEKRSKYTHIWYMTSWKVVYPEETFDSYTNIAFEGQDFLIYSNYDTILRMIYGNYLMRPPEEEQHAKHSTLYSTTQPYSEYILSLKKNQNE